MDKKESKYQYGISRESLIDRLKCGNEEAWIIFDKVWKKPILRYFRFLGNSGKDAEDLFQIFNMKLLKHLTNTDKEFQYDKGKRKFHGLLKKIALNTYIDYYRKGSIRVPNKPLFEVMICDSRTVDDLDNGLLPHTLLNQFEENLAAINAETPVNLLISRKKWELCDTGKAFTIVNEENKLCVYEQNQPRQRREVFFVDLKNDQDCSNPMDKVADKHQFPLLESDKTFINDLVSESLKAALKRVSSDKAELVQLYKIRGLDAVAVAERLKIEGDKKYQEAYVQKRWSSFLQEQLLPEFNRLLGAYDDKLNPLLSNRNSRQMILECFANRAEFFQTMESPPPTQATSKRINFAREHTDYNSRPIEAGFYFQQLQYTNKLYHSLQWFKLDKNKENTIGRANVSIEIDEAGISKNHATIFCEQEQWFIKDHSTNGTRHNQNKMTKNVIEPAIIGDQIQIGKNLLLFHQIEPKI